MKRVVLNFLVIVVIAFTTCKNENENDDFFGEHDVYVAGWIFNENSIAAVWKNDILQKLTDGTNDAMANSIYVSDGDVLVAGYVSNGNAYIAAVWKNGEVQHLTDGTNMAKTNSVFVSGNDVFVVGYEEPFGAKLWINGVAQNLSDVQQNAYANSVFVSSGNVYVAGEVDVIATVWKNGVEQNLIGGTISAHVRSIYVNDGYVYVAGIQHNDLTRVATVWKDGVVQNLTDGTRMAWVNSINVSDDKVYVVGNEDYPNDMGGLRTVAKLWINGEEQILNEDMRTGSDANSVYIYGDNVYIVGYEVNLAIGFATIWKNGKAKKLQKENGWAVANSVFVVK